MVFYLKYRPQKIDELDSEKVREALYQVLTLPSIPHAFLLTGPKGLGKTSAARILAKAVNCERKLKIEKGKLKINAKNKNSQPSTLDLQLLEPCNICEQCITITNGTNLDILEIDAASNRGIDEIRDLREKIRLSPSSASKKVYIIDEVHMLTPEAFNALLKTLEEPPSHAMFILCTTELHKVPATIISRCFHIPFLPATVSDIERSFKRVAEGEGLILEKPAVQAIAKLADSGFRDAHKILEELVAAGHKEITLEAVEKRFRVAGSMQQVMKMLQSLAKRDTKESLRIVQEVIDQGLDIKQFLLQLIEQIHLALLKKAGVGEEDRATASKTDGIGMLDTSLTIIEIADLLMLLNKSANEMKYSVLANLPLELAIIAWSEGVQEGNEKAVINDGQGDTAIYKHKTTGLTVAALRKQAGDLARVKALYGESLKNRPAKTANTVKDFSLLQVSNTEITKEWMEIFWPIFINEIKPYNHTIAGVLRSCHIVEFDKETLRIEAAYKFHKERLSDAKTIQILEQVCKTLVGKPVRVEVVLKQ